MRVKKDKKIALYIVMLVIVSVWWVMHGANNRRNQKEYIKARYFELARYIWAEIQIEIHENNDAEIHEIITGISIPESIASHIDDRIVFSVVTNGQPWSSETPNELAMSLDITDDVQVGIRFDGALDDKGYLSKEGVRRYIWKGGGNGNERRGQERREEGVRRRGHPLEVPVKYKTPFHRRFSTTHWFFLLIDRFHAIFHR